MMGPQCHLQIYPSARCISRMLVRWSESQEVQSTVDETKEASRTRVPGISPTKESAGQQMSKNRTA